MTKPRAPKFGERFVNTMAGESNPNRSGMFVRVVRRTGRMNRGTFWEMTDGKGDFWQIPPENCVREAS